MTIESIVAGGHLVERDGDATRVGPAVDIQVVDGVITDVDRASVDPGGHLDARGHLLIPGLVNGHTHSHEGFHRGRYPKLPLERWMHFVRPPLPIEFTPEELYLRTAMSALDALHGGATTVMDDVGLPMLDDDQLDAVIRGYDDVGVRAVVAPTLFDRPFAESVPFADEELTPRARDVIAAAPRVAPEAALELVRARLAPPGRGGGLVTLGIAASAPQRCTDAFLLELIDAARDADVPVICHVNETRLQAVTAQRLYGETMVAHLERIGGLDHRLSIVHGIWLTSDDLRRLAAAGATLQHNPTSNLRLGSGVADLAAAREAGVSVSLGSDGVGSGVANAMFPVVKQAALLSTVRGSPDRWTHAHQAMAMATSGGARALGLAGRLGEIAPGQLADLIGVRLDDRCFSPLNDPLRQLVYADQHRVELALVGGRLVMSHGVVTRVDEVGLRRRIQRAHDRLRPRLEAADRFVMAELAPSFARIIARTDAIDIPEDTLVARFER
jgi:5-methylthioadenosine/S-adenosylhomocysteine deaminase